MPSITFRATPAQSAAIEDLLSRKRQRAISASDLLRQLLNDYLSECIFTPEITTALREEALRGRTCKRFGTRQLKLFKGRR